MFVEHIRISQHARDRLVKLKRQTGIKHWNVLCRWAFALSLAEPTPPPKARIPTDSNLEMSWKVFGGAYHEVYAALMKQRCIRDGLDTSNETLARQFRLHLHRGIGYLAAEKLTRGNICTFMRRLPLAETR